jgi:hypothetical protein
MSTRLLLLILVIVVLIAVLPTWPYSRGWSYYPGGILGVILIIVLILLVLGQLNHGVPFERRISSQRALGASHPAHAAGLQGKVSEYRTIRHGP